MAKPATLGRDPESQWNPLTDGQETRGREQQDRYTLQAEWWQSYDAHRALHSTLQRRIRIHRTGWGLIQGPVTSVTASGSWCKTQGWRLIFSAACRGITQRVECGRIYHLDTPLLWVQMAVKAKRLWVGIIAGQTNPSDIGTKPLNAARLRELMFLMGAKTEDLEPSGEQDHNEACAKRGMAKVFKEIKDSRGNRQRAAHEEVTSHS